MNNESEINKLRQFEEWLRSEGALFPKIGFQQFDAYDGGWGASVKESIDAEEAVVSVPLHILVTFQDMHRSFQASTTFSKFLPLLQQPAEEDQRELTGGSGTTAEWVLFYVFMLLERAKGCQSKWHAYWQILPASIDSAISYSPAELDLLKGTNLLAAILYIKEMLLHHSQRFAQVLEEDDSEDAQLFRQHCTIQSITWAYQAFWSRAYVVLIDGKETPSLVPLADMLNHSSTSRVTYLTDATQSSFKLVTHDTIAAHGEFFSNYGSRSNEKLLLNYGFMEDNNPHDTYMLILKRPIFHPDDDDPNLEPQILRKQQLLSKVGLTHDISSPSTLTHIPLASSVLSSSPSSSSSTSFSTSLLDSPVSDQLLDALRILQADHVSLYEWDSTPSHLRSMQFPRNEILAMILLKDFLLQRLSRFTETAEDDDALLAHPTALTASAKNCIKYRRIQKTILRSALAWAESTISSLSARLFSPPADALAVPIDTLADPDFFAVYHPKIQRFESWAHAHGMSDDCKIQLFPNGDVHLVATRDIAAGQPIISIPAALLINMQTAEQSKHGPLLMAIAKLLDVEDALFLMLMLEREATKISRSQPKRQKSAPASKSFWQPFFDALPPSTGYGTINFEASELSCLGGTALSTQTSEILQYLQEDYTKLVQALKTLKAFSSQYHTWRLYLWARCVYETRCVHLANGPNVIPIPILPAHHPHALVERSLDDKGSFQMTSSCSGYYVNDIIYDYYGGMDNAHLLLYHGRSNQHNVYDFFPLSLSILPDDPQCESKYQLLLENGSCDHPLRLNAIATPGLLLDSLRIIHPNLSESEYFSSLVDMLKMIQSALKNSLPPATLKIPSRLQAALNYTRTQLEIINHHLELLLLIQKKEINK